MRPIFEDKASISIVVCFCKKIPFSAALDCGSIESRTLKFDCDTHPPPIAALQQEGRPTFKGVNSRLVSALEHLFLSAKAY